ncbi:MAG: matrixin family metalloprotease [Candidatus Obscuribacterales bacterium]|nr:matrixin family metalloprotease [Candidatus Obscuribacterales bacterium]
MLKEKSEQKNPSLKRRGLIATLLVLLLLLTGMGSIVFALYGAKLHLHVPVKSADGKSLKYWHIRRNLSPVELFTYAQAHDISGETELASEDFKATLIVPGFEKLPGRLKSTLEELADSRDFMAKDDYFSELVTHSRVCFWKKEQMPLKIYVPDSSQKDGFNDFDREEIRKCFSEWCAVVPDSLSFKMLSRPENADIVFRQKNTLADLSYSHSVLAHTIPIASGPERWSVFPCSKASIEPLRMNPAIESASDPRAAHRHVVFMHEIGHSLGLIGHSSNSSDLMFFTGSNGISKRDKASLRRIYAAGSLYERAEAALREAAARNDKYALVQMAVQLDECGTASPQRLKEIFELTKRAAAMGSNRAILMLGWMYHDGNGVRRDLRQAAKYFHRAAELGYAPALLALAGAYERGDGEEQNIALAEKYYKMALKMDLARAPLAYGNFLSYQFGDADSLARAAAFYKRSQDNQVDSMIRLALLYEHGEGLPRDNNAAARLRARAHEQLSRLKAADAAEYYARACVYADLCESEKAVADFSEALKTKRDFRGAYLGKAAAEQALGKNEDAIRDYDAALKLDPDSAQAYLGRAYSNLALQKPADCLKDVDALLSICKRPDSDRLYALIVGSVAARVLKDEVKAGRMLSEADSMCKPEAWPKPIVAFLSHSINEEEFLKEARGYSRSTEVRAYLALEQSLSGKTKDAMANFAWVKENGDKSFYEYPVALAQLERLQKQPAR